MKGDPDNIHRYVILHHIQSDETKALLNVILEWLESAHHDENLWDAYTDFAEICLAKMLATSEATSSPIIQTSSTQRQAITYVRAMISAMQTRDRVAALENGQAAIRNM